MRAVRAWYEGRIPTIISWVVRLALAGGVSPVAAQTGVQEPYPPIDVGTYRTVEECLVAIDRIREDLSPSEILPWQPLPDTVRSTAARCGARYTPADSNLAAYPLFGPLRLFLVAHRDADAMALVKQRQARIAISDTAGHRAIEDDLLYAYRYARRKAESEAILEARLRRVVGTDERLFALDEIKELAEKWGDTAQSRTRAAQIAAEGERDPDPSRGLTVLRALVRLQHQELLDSLRKSTASYAALSRSFWQRGGGRLKDLSHGFGETGQPYAPLTADFWFGDSGQGSRGPRPTPGQVSLLIGLGDRPYICLRHGCPMDFARLRQLAQRFPDLEITLVTETGGYFAERAEQDPAKEAALLWWWVHDSRHLPGQLAVSRGSLKRLPAPDRRVLRPGPRGLAVRPQAGTVVLVGRDGLVVDIPGNGMSNYAGQVGEGLEELIEATLQQRSAGGTVPHP